MNLRVKPGTVPIPHVVTFKKVTYVFAPDCTVPDEYGAALLKTYPDLFTEAKGEPSKDGYAVKSESKKKLLADAIAGLTEAQQGVVLQFILNLQREPQDDQPGSDKVELTEEGLNKLKVPELKKLADELNMDISEAGNKAEIIQKILEIKASR